MLLLCRNKRETRSYVEISQSLGVDDPSEILFVTDVYQEATAAKAAGNCSYFTFLNSVSSYAFRVFPKFCSKLIVSGLDVIVSVRPGNGPLPENHGFKTVNSFSEI